jgi:GNAT superfamily N-acetyltransferase
MNFRPIEPPDLPELIELRASTRENALSREALRELGITEESTAGLLRTTHRGWLCEEAGRIVGFAIGDGRTGELWVIAVLPGFEGKGVGSQLLQPVEAWLWSLGWDELWLWTSPDRRKRAFAFYQRHGWQVSELKEDRLYMKKRKPGLSSGPGGHKKTAPRGARS